MRNTTSRNPDVGAASAHPRGRVGAALAALTAGALLVGACAATPSATTTGQNNGGGQDNGEVAFGDPAALGRVVKNLVPEAPTTTVAGDPNATDTTPPVDPNATDTTVGGGGGVVTTRPPVVTTRPPVVVTQPTVTFAPPTPVTVDPNGGRTPPNNYTGGLSAEGNELAAGIGLQLESSLMASAAATSGVANPGLNSSVSWSIWAGGMRNGNDWPQTRDACIGEMVSARGQMGANYAGFAYKVDGTFHYCYWLVARY